MSLKPAAEWVREWDEHADEGILPDASFYQRVQANAEKAGREAGFAEAIAEAKAEATHLAALYRELSEEPGDFQASGGYTRAASACDEVAENISKLTCPPAADGSEGSDGE